MVFNICGAILENAECNKLTAIVCSWLETVVFNICDAILENAECNKLTAIVCLDLSAAFDTVTHSILKTVMEHYFGFNYWALQWLSSYISHRLFSVKIGGSFSHAHTINFSVLQGRILGPVLFSCYVSTLHQVIKQTFNTKFWIMQMTMSWPRPSPKRTHL